MRHGSGKKLPQRRSQTHYEEVDKLITHNFPFTETLVMHYLRALQRGRDVA